MVYAGGWLGQDNLGDEALLIASRRLFHKFALVQYPRSSRELRMLCRLFRPARVAVSSGGTLLNRSTSHLAVMQECSTIFPHSFVFGAGVGDPVYWAERSEWKDLLPEWKPVLARCTYVGVRGPRSAEILGDIGIEAEVIGDPVIALADPKREAETEVVPDSVGLNIGQSYGNVWGSEREIQQEFVRLATLANNAGWKVRWFVVWPEDLAITVQTARDSGTESEICEVYRDPEAFLDLVRPLSVFAGIKLHAVVLATCAHVPSVMLEYRPKCRDYMRSIEQEEYVVRTDSFKGAQVWDTLRSLDARRSHFSDILAERITLLKNRQFERASGLTQVFMKH